MERANNLKAGCYFLDADMAGTAVIPAEAWVEGAGDVDSHGHALVILVGFSRMIKDGQPGDAWIDGTRQATADLRATELAVIMADYIRNLGFEATAHTPESTELDIGRVALQAGLVEINGTELSAPFLTGGFALAVVSTELEIAVDAPLASRSPIDGLRTTFGPSWMLGRGGVRGGIARLNGDHRPLHMGRYPMEKIKRVDQSTTLIIEDEVPRVPVRAGGFPRAAHGDMGPKFQAEVKVFAYKTPQAQSYRQQIGEMVPFQDGPMADEPHPSTSDAAVNTNDLKALGLSPGRRHGRRVPGTELRVVFTPR